MTNEKLKKYMHSLECQKRDAELLATDGAYCLRKLQEHLEGLQDMRRRLRETDLIDDLAVELEKEEVAVRDAVEFYQRMPALASESSVAFVSPKRDSEYDRTLP